MPTSSKPTISPAKLAANRRNAQLSTGPTSIEGKLKSSLNALRHGLTSNTCALLATEDPWSFAHFKDEILADLNVAASPTERNLADHIVNLLWRLRRLPNAEAQLFDSYNDQRRNTIERQNEATAAAHADFVKRRPTAKNLPPPPEPQPTEDLPADRLLAHFFTHHDDSSNPFCRLQRYESRLTRQLHRALDQLRQLKKLRDQYPPPDPDTDPTPYSPELQAELDACNNDPAPESDPKPDDENGKNEPTAPPQTIEPPTTNHDPQTTNNNTPTPPPSSSRPSPPLRGLRDRILSPHPAPLPAPPAQPHPPSVPIEIVQFEATERETSHGP